MIPIVTPEQMAAIDAAAPAPVEELIGRAGRAVADAALDLLGGAYGRLAVVIAGPGNNGADGRVAADLLRRRGVSVRVVDVASCPPELDPCDLVIDAAYGTGFHGEWQAPALRPTVGKVARDRRGERAPQRPIVLAVDIPSGVDATTGSAGDGVLRADRTVTFQALKPGLLFGAGKRLAGEVHVADIGLDVSSADRFLVEPDDVADWVVHRRPDAHKWKSAVRVVAGSAGMLGAAELCSAAAARAGAGMVALSCPGVAANPRSEIVQRSIPVAGFADEVLADLDRFGALVVGPGLGRDEETIDAIRRLITEAAVPLVLDGDGLFAAAWSSEGAGALLRVRGPATVVTPHDGEYAVLHGSAPTDDRIEAARVLADELDCVVVLKGPSTVVAAPRRATFVMTAGDQRLATAGTGDVLAGIVAAQLAAGAAPLEAAAGGAWLHAAASRRGRRVGQLAGDLIDHLPEVLDDLHSRRHPTHAMSSSATRSRRNSSRSRERATR